LSQTDRKGQFHYLESVVKIKTINLFLFPNKIQLKNLIARHINQIR